MIAVILTKQKKEPRTQAPAQAPALQHLQGRAVTGDPGIRGWQGDARPRGTRLAGRRETQGYKACRETRDPGVQGLQGDVRPRGTRLSGRRETQGYKACIETWDPGVQGLQGRWQYMGMQDLRVQRMGNEGVNLGQMFPPPREKFMLRFWQSKRVGR